MSGTDPVAAARARMAAAGLPRRVIDLFSAQQRRWLAGETGHLPWEAIRPPSAGDIVPARATQTESYRARGRALLSRLACIKLNGGLGTTMKLAGPKALIPVQKGRTFLDLAIDQAKRLRRAAGAETPLLFMHSFRTRQACLPRIAAALDQPAGLPHDFLQHRVPRLLAAGGGPADLPGDDAWAPPGHGDLYLALFESGLLERLVGAGYRWAFVSNVDNLGATVDEGILGYLDAEGIAFAMEVTPKSPADRKGGTLVRYRGRLALLERAQVAPEHQADFEDLERLRVFNTNTIWWRLDAMLERLRAGPLDLPLIVNPKRVAGRDVVQLETAMGAAIGAFARAIGVEVGRERFAPVKGTADLMALRSDAYVLDEAGGVRPNPARDPALGPPVVRLDDAFFKGLDDFEARAPHPLSLVACRSLEVRGDVRFGRGVRVAGDAVVTAPPGETLTVPDGAELGEPAA